MTIARIAGATSQATFDVIMRTLSEPGTVRSLPSELHTRDVPAIGWLALALADVGVNVAANQTALRNSNPPLTDTVAEATGATITHLDSAWIALLDQPTATELAQLPRGSALEPELGARLAIAVDALGREPATSSTELVLTGPGIPGRRTLYTSGVNPDVLAGLGRSSGEFPAGLDTWLFTPDGLVAAISRSTTLTIGQEN